MATALSRNTSAGNGQDACLATFDGHAADIATRPLRAHRRHSASGGTQDGWAKRRSAPSRQALVFSQQCVQWTARHSLAIVAEVLFVHCVLVGLSGFRLCRHFRP
jgi:hypothetical protein